MAESLATFDPGPALKQLKDFQRDTVDYVFRRLYEDPDPARRFLVADEAGLGKTLVARGLIARAIARLRDQGVPRIDILYICSNADIARQNLDKLRVEGAQDPADPDSLPSRITLLPLHLKRLNRRGVNLIAFTPGTSFDLKSGIGMGRERALLYHLLREAWGLTDAGTLKALQGNMNADNFHELVKDISSSGIDPTIKAGFAQRLNDEAGLREQFDRTRDRYRMVRNPRNVEEDERLKRSDVVGRLRVVLAQSCLHALEPDLIILDEFQRFKHLLDEGNEAGELARRLFDYGDERSQARVVLLSATPYKMYTLRGEEGDDHHSDFLQTVDFLLRDKAQIAQFKAALQEYRHELFHLGARGPQRLGEIKDELEQTLRRVMVRTERLATSPERNGMLRSASIGGMQVKATELRAYCAYQAVAGLLGQNDTLEYWKSAPYLLNFMEGYKLKEEFRANCANGRAGELAEALAGASGLLPREAIAHYAALDPLNARLRHLEAELDAAGAYHMLWLPPALPYYRLAGPFASEAAQRFTKRLIFSSWRVAPKAIATLVSYEAERQLISSRDPSAVYAPDAGKTRLLKWTPGESAPGPLFALVYPSVYLSRVGDPLALALARKRAALPDVEELLGAVADRIRREMEQAGLRGAKGGREDERWYWAAPILLDRRFHPAQAGQWWDQPDPGAQWMQTRESAWADAGEPDEEANPRPYLQEAVRCWMEGLELGRQPEDLPVALAAVALGAPGVIALRALMRAANTGYEQLTKKALQEASAVAWAFRSLFNTPEATALIRDPDHNSVKVETRRKSLLERIFRTENRETGYWRKALEYCVAGCLQSVVDEYAHLLVEATNTRDAGIDKVATEVGPALVESLTLRTASLKVDDIGVGERAVQIKAFSMRAHFAVRFGDETNDVEGKEVLRKEQVRKAFNSPFWPFVLATTSVGQEGLDFHRYCHAVVHWNLPANPVDLEQREGRVHRYKGHAVRKNLGLRYGLDEARNAVADPWQTLFEAGRRDRAAGVSDLVPYWVFPPPDPQRGAYIERHIPALALSRDTLRSAELLAALALYRVVFGQPRQEELMAHLSRHAPAERIAELSGGLLISLEPPRAVSR